MIIALGYRARSGKDTVADYLVENHGFRKTAFAKKLKEAARVIFGLTDEQLNGCSRETVDLYWRTTPRTILQTLGTECLRYGYAEDVWIRALRREILSDPGARWVISDCRFTNEAEAVKAWGGFVVKIDRPNLPPISRLPRTWWQRALGMPGSEHPSERAMRRYNGWDQVIYNTGTIDDLYKDVDEVVDCLEVGR